MRLTAKKLFSGKHQIKFEVKKANKPALCGYLLAQPDSTLKEVVEKIMDTLLLFEQPESHYDKKLFALNLKRVCEKPTVVYVKNDLNGMIRKVENYL